MEKTTKVPNEMRESRIGTSRRDGDNQSRERLDVEARKAYRDFVEKVNRAKDAEIQRALMMR